MGNIRKIHTQQWFNYFKKKMKILFIRGEQYQDYLTDMIYHGLISLNHDIYLRDNTSYDFMYSWGSINNKGNRNLFSIYGKLNGSPNYINDQTILEYLNQCYFDKIIFSNHRNVYWYWSQKYFFSKYNKWDINFIDGSDDPFILEGTGDYGVLWKRELINNKANPISFAIPEEQIMKNIPIKEKLFGTVIPNKPETYIFTDEKSYYNDYAVAYYGKTWKKAGWDCVRHYEILANGCIPYFFDIDNCPSNTMVNFPKDIIKETNKYAHKSIIHPDYDKINNELINYTIKNLTTKVLADKIINF